MLKSILLFSILFFMSNVYAQEKMIVFLKDKEQKSTIAFSKRSEIRRAKNNVVIDSKDFPVSKNYIKALSADGQILNESRWLNAVTIETKFFSRSIANKI